MSKSYKQEYLTSTCDLWGSDLIVALCTSYYNGDHLCQVILKTFQQIKLFRGHKKWTINIWLLSVTLTLEVVTLLLCFAHHDIKVIICAKLC